MQRTAQTLLIYASSASRMGTAVDRRRRLMMMMYHMPVYVWLFTWLPIGVEILISARAATLTSSIT